MKKLILATSIPLLTSIFGWAGKSDKSEPVKNENFGDLKKKLTPLQYKVTQEKGTEPPFKNEYWDNKKDGIYVDLISGDPLFSSNDKLS